MDLSNIMSKRCEWLDVKGPRSSIALSTRVRLARNLREHIYFNRANDTQRGETLNTLLLCFKHSPSFRNADILMMRELSEIDKTVLVERHLMSGEHMSDDRYKALVVEHEQIISAMINEEDHLRLQVLRSGFNLREAWSMADSMDDELSRNVVYDYSNRFGYLTACPTNTGTGLRASVMLHLSALAMTGEIDRVYEGISKLGLTMRGFYGEGTDALGDFFQISNQVALGHSELEAVNYLEGLINRIITREEELRNELLEKRNELVADRVFRS
jgi:protein arginine kinase